MPKAPKTPAATHLTATMRVLHFHLGRPSVTAADAQERIKRLALELGTGEPTKDDLVLEEKLRKATGVSVAELARFAEDWPTDASP